MRERGFTAVELLVSVALFATLSAVGIALLASASQTMRANSQATRIAGLIQLARENAIRSQRDLELTFDAGRNAVSVIRTIDGEPSTIAEVTLEYQMGLRTFAAVGDTPDAFGKGAAADFGDAERVFFISDGSLVDEDSVPVNGTIFLGVEGQPVTARAVTITGTTARPRKYRWLGTQWSVQ